MKKSSKPIALIVLLLFALPAAPVIGSSSKACSNVTNSSVVHNADGTHSTWTMTITMCPTNALDAVHPLDAYQSICTSTYEVRNGGTFNNWLWTWGMSECWTADLTTNRITYFWNPPTTFFSQCCRNLDGLPTYTASTASASASLISPNQIQVHASGYVQLGVFYCFINGICFTTYVPFASPSCSMIATGTHFSGSCSG